MLKHCMNIMRLSADQRGTAAIEYAIILPVFTLLIMGTIEYSMAMYASSIVEGATITAARAAKTGYIASGMSQQAYINSIVQQRVGGLLDSTKITTSSKSYSTWSGTYGSLHTPWEPCIPSSHQPPCVASNGSSLRPGIDFTDMNGNGSWDSDLGSAGLGTAGDIVVYTVSYPWPITTPLIQNFLGTNGVFTISSSSVVKNEPYTVSR